MNEQVKRYDAVHIRYEDNNIRYGEGCEVEVVTARDYDALEAEFERLQNALLEITARRFAESWKKRTSDAELEQYLSAGIAQLEAERDKLAGLLREKFPRIDPHTPVPLNEVDHCCEYVLYQERERLHKVIDAALAELTP